MNGDVDVTMDHKKMSVMFKALCDENRLRILQLLRDGERCACSLLEEMRVTQPTLSHHMKILCDAGVVVGRKEGKWMHYSISDEGLGEMRECLDYFADHSAEIKEKSCCEE